MEEALKNSHPQEDTVGSSHEQNVGESKAPKLDPATLADPIFRRV